MLCTGTKHDEYRATISAKGSSSYADMVAAYSTRTGRRLSEMEWKFVPALVGQLRAVSGAQLAWQTRCFHASASIRNNSLHAIEVILNLQRRSSSPLICQDTYFLATPYRCFSPEVEMFPGTHILVWGVVQADEWQDLQDIGVRVFALDQSLRATLLQVHSTFQVSLAVSFSLSLFLSLSLSFSLFLSLSFAPILSLSLSLFRSLFFSLFLSIRSRISDSNLHRTSS
jgi:hypothetical protein